MNETVVSEKFIKGLRKIAEMSNNDGDAMFPARGALLKAYRAGAQMGGVSLAQVLCDQIGVIYTNNLDEKELDNLKEQDNV